MGSSVERHEARIARVMMEEEEGESREEGERREEVEGRRGRARSCDSPEEERGGGGLRRTTSLRRRDGSWDKRSAGPAGGEIIKTVSFSI